jgi:hypothetical protein
VVYGFPAPLWAQVIMTAGVAYFIAMTVDLSLRSRS